MKSDDPLELAVFFIKCSYGPVGMQSNPHAIQAYDILRYGWEQDEWRGAAKQLRLASESLEINTYKVMAQSIERHCEITEQEDAEEAEKLRLKKATKDQATAQEQLNLF